jgi:hypothetical protein
MRALPVILMLLAVHILPAQPQDTAATIEKGSAAEVKRYDYFFQHTSKGIDTLLQDFTRFRPAEKAPVPHGFLGPQGSASYPLIYMPSIKPGARLGFQQYDLYRKEVDSLQFFFADFPYTDLYYAQGLHGLQLFQAQFGMAVHPQVELGFDYDIVSDNGFLSDRRHQHRGNYLDAHLRYQSRNGRHKTLAGYVLNDVKARETGGIDTSRNTLDEIFTTSRSPADALVVLDAASQFAENVFYFHQRYRLGNMTEADTAGNRVLVPNGHELFYDMRYQTQKFTYRDEAPGQGYQQFLLSPDSTSDFTVANTWSHKAGWKFISGDTATNNLQMAAFASWDHWTIDQQGRQYTLNDMAANGTLGIRLGQGFHLDAHGQYHVGDYGFGDWILRGNLSLQPVEVAKLAVYAKLVRSTPAFISQHYLSNHYYWEQEAELDKQTFTSLGGTLKLTPVNLLLGTQWSVTDNLVYFGESGMPQQHDPAFSVWKFWLKHHFAIGNFNMETKAWFQLFPEDAPLNLPHFVSRHRLYFNMQLFEAKVPTHIGVEVYYHTPYGYPSYGQVTGQFHISGKEGRSTYPVIEPYISMKIRTARLFFKVTNADQFYPFEDSYYFARNYPIAPTGFAFGVSWRLFN